MSWGHADTALVEQVSERQRKTIETYAIDPDLLAEHVGMEDNFQAGGYGERQIEELLQNAVDQLTFPGRVEMRLLDRALYCANEGSPFGADGIRAITHAFLSSKDGEKIGRFGLGFKSVLGVTDRPQILSRSISFGFNEPAAERLLADLPSRPKRLPTLRVPSVLDPVAIAGEDPNVAEMMEWASTIVKLPLTRGASGLRARLWKFDPRYLLFPENLARVDIVMADASGKPSAHTFRRRRGAVDGVVELEAPTGETSTWRVLRRDHKVSEKVAAAVPELFRRDQVTVSYALEQGKTGVGEFWAWFPLLDQTTASGIFNAPWQVNDDRTSLLPNSALNRELLEVAAELLIDAALLESSPADPAKHFEVLPARGRETRSAADGYLSERTPQLARRHELIPTSMGSMRSPLRVRAPMVSGQLNRFALPADMIRRWAEATGNDDAPHWTCYSTPTRAARLAQLLTDENDKVACKTVSPVAWLSEAARPRTLDAIDHALSIYLRAKEEKEELWSQFAAAAVLPLEDGSFAKLSDAAALLLPVAGPETPSGIPLVASEFSNDAGIRAKLAELGVREVSRDQVAAAAAAAVAEGWSDTDWQRLWDVLAPTSLGGGQAAIDLIHVRGIPVRVPTKSGEWRAARGVFRSADSVPGLPNRQPDFARVGGRADLLEAAGCLDDLVEDFPVHEEQVFAPYSEAMQQGTAKWLVREYGPSTRGRLHFETYTGVGPLDVLPELAASSDPRAPVALANWSARVLYLLRSAQATVKMTITGHSKLHHITITSPEIWCFKKYGLVETSLGLRRPGAVVAAALSRYGDLLPVAKESYPTIFEPPGDLAEAPLGALRVVMERDDYELADHEALVEILAACAAREEFVASPSLPAIDARSNRVRLTTVADVVLAGSEELDDLGPHGLRYLPSGRWDDQLIAAWSLQRASEVVARSIDWIPVDDFVPLLDVYPTLATATTAQVDDIALRRCSEIVRRTASPSGVRERRLASHIEGGTVFVDAELDVVATLVEVARRLELRLTEADAENVVRLDNERRRSKLVEDVAAEQSEPQKLLLLVGRERLAEHLPLGLLGIIEQRQGQQSDRAVAELFINTYGNDALRRLKEPLGAVGLAVPRQWDGTPDSEQFVTSLGFPRAFAGTRERKAPTTELVPGKVELSPLHDFQETLRDQIRELVLIREKDGNYRRGLLYLPTGGGKTRVTTESIVAMLRDDELDSPILWIAQSEELCEQAILSWTEVWRAIGDERPLEITRYWDTHEADESHQELQVVVATDAKLASMLDRGSKAHRWLQQAKLVVIDEAHRAGSPTYTKILSWLGIVRDARGTTTERPLLGLTATPYRGTNEEVNKQFVARFGERRLNALDEDDPIGQLRTMKVLSEVEHQLLDGIEIHDSPTEGSGGRKTWDDVSRAILAKLGDNLDRTQELVDHVMAQDPDWPILVFTPTVVAAHVTAALIRSQGRPADAVDGEMRGQERRRKIEAFRAGDTKVLVNCDLLTQGFDAPKVRALYIARPTFSPNRYVQMVGRGLRGPLNGGTEECLVVNVVDTFTQFDRELAYTEFDYLWTKQGVRAR